MRRNTKILYNFNPILTSPLVYAILKMIAPLFIPTSIFNEIINPAFLLLIAIAFIYYTKNHHGRFLPLLGNIKMFIIIALAYLIANVLLGFIFSFAYNPYSTEFFTFIKNVWQIIVPIISIEYIRSAVANQNYRSPKYIAIFVIILGLLEINFYTFYNNLTDFETIFKYMTSTIIPIFSFSAIFTYFTIKISYIPIMLYRVITQLVFLITPIVPNLDWYMIGVREFGVAAIIFFTFKYYTKEPEDTIRTVKVNRFKQAIVFMPALLIATTLFLFVTNNLTYAPVSIISNSMDPIFNRGDVVVYQRSSKEIIQKLQKNDIIVYNKNGQLVVHRIIDKYVENEKNFYITKGDANNGRDVDPIEESSVVGYYKITARGMGWPSIWLREAFNNNETPNVETK